MAGNIFANAGLVAQGMDASRERALRLAEMERANRFNTENDPIRLEESRQRSRRDGLGLEEAGMSLEEIRRRRAGEAEMRSAVSGADPTTGRAGLLTIQRDTARKLGNAEGVLSAQKAIDALEGEGAGVLARGALMGDDPAMVAERFNKIGHSRILPGSISYGKVGDDIVVRAVSANDNKPYFFNASKYGKISGILKPEELVVVPENAQLRGKESGVLRGANPRTESRFAPNTGVEKVKFKDADGNERDYVLDLVNSKPGAPQWIGEAPPQGSMRVDGSGIVRRDLQITKQIDDSLAMVPELATTDMSDPMNPKIRWSAKGLQLRNIAGRIQRANRGFDPQQIVDLVTNGKPTYRNVDGKRTPGVLYDDQFFPIEGPRGMQVESATPASAVPAPSIAPAKVPSVAPAVAEPGLEPAISTGGKAEQILAARGLTGLIGELQKRYPPASAGRHPRTGRPMGPVDHPEIQKLKAMRGQQMIDYANKLLSPYYTARPNA